MAINFVLKLTKTCSAKRAPRSLLAVDRIASSTYVRTLADLGTLFVKEVALSARDYMLRHHPELANLAPKRQLGRHFVPIAPPQRHPLW